MVMPGRYTKLQCAKAKKSILIHARALNCETLPLSQRMTSGSCGSLISISLVHSDQYLAQKEIIKVPIKNKSHR